MLRPVLTCLAVAALLTGCSQGGGSSDAAPSAQERLESARSAAASWERFAFRSVTELPGGDALQRTTVDGRVELPDRVAYRVTVGASEVEVVRIGAASFSRTLPGGSWRAAAPASDLPSPATVLREVLAAADGPVDRGDVTFDGREGRLIEVTLEADEVRESGLLDAAGGSDVTVTLALDPRGRVLRLAVELPVQAGTRNGALRQVTTYGSFDTADPVVAPI